MKPDPAKLLEDALRLSPEARAAEIAKRIQELDSGAVAPVPWADS
jgi:hypothetical protein